MVTRCHWVDSHRCPLPATTTHHTTPLCHTHGAAMRSADRTLNKIIIGICVFIAVMIMIIAL